MTASALPPRHRELLWLRTAWLARSNYLWAQRAPVARRLGLTADDLVRIAVGSDAPGWDAFEAALLRAADELRVDAFIAGATWATLAAELEPRQLLDALIAVGGYRSASYAINSVGVQLDANMAEFRFPPELR